MKYEEKVIENPDEVKVGDKVSFFYSSIPTLISRSSRPLWMKEVRTVKKVEEDTIYLESSSYAPDEIEFIHYSHCRLLVPKEPVTFEANIKDYTEYFPGPDGYLIEVPAYTELKPGTEVKVTEILED